MKFTHNQDSFVSFSNGVSSERAYTVLKNKHFRFKKKIAIHFHLKMGVYAETLAAFTVHFLN
ncbi:hypothetical protein CW304_00610 [Bacillus sp. UFRGS-B20]|nr:hypothetical protein CW304_00610 [Bacillus sp. UFRGS-B20]